MTNFNRSYNDKVNLMQDFYSFHPEYFAKLSKEDQELLSRFYFADRKVDVDDIFVYRKGQIEQDRDIEKRAEGAYFRLLATADVKP